MAIYNNDESFYFIGALPSSIDANGDVLAAHYHTSISNSGTAVKPLITDN